MMNIFALIMQVVDSALAGNAKKEEIRGQVAAAMLAQSGDLQAAQAEIISSEAKSESWLTRAWRPIAMLNFLVLLNLYWLGLAPAYLVNDPGLVSDLFGLLTVGIGGYIGGRSLEKTARGAIEAMRAK